MPEDSKKHKGKHEAKEQRKLRQSRNLNAGEKPEKKEKKIDETKVTSVSKVKEEPGPEFYKGLKRETDEIIKITEEANTKYKKKEIQSNWSKYEMPIESYDEIEEHENLGADYEKLISAPLSIGGHFQFKHERSWDIDTGPSLYDKYFEINMENLATAISTVPFYERNDLDMSMFNENDILSMNTRAVKYKRKYYNDKTYTTPELEAQDKIINSATRNNDEESKETIESKINTNQSTDIVFNSVENLKKEIRESEASKVKLQDIDSQKSDSQKNQVVSEDIDDIDDILLRVTKIATEDAKTEDQKVENAPLPSPAVKPNDNTNRETNQASNIAVKSAADEKNNTKNESKKPTIDSPEDLEKWLDDFLDG